jgi:hypothetical protein
MCRTGKIAGLPKEIRTTLNRRLENNEEGPKILKWLNGSPEVRRRLKSQFNGVPISKQNLSEWRNGGYREWLIHEELHQCAFDTAAEVRMMQDEFDVSLLAGALAAKLSIRYAGLLAEWDGLPNKKIEAQLRILRTMAHDIGILQRTLQRATEHNDVVATRRKEESDPFSPRFPKRLFRELDAEFGGQAKSKQVKPVKPVKPSKVKKSKLVATKHVKAKPTPPPQPDPVKEAKSLHAPQQDIPEVSEPPVTETIDTPPSV